MKATVQVKDEPVEVNYSNDTVNELLRLYGYTLTDPSAAKALKTTSPRTKSTLHAEQEPTTCAWCQKLGVRSFSLRTDNGDSKTLCSEVCFNHYRRASFKKNKGSEPEFTLLDPSPVSFLPTKLDRSPLIKPKVDREKKIKPSNETHLPSAIEASRRKILLPFRRPTPSKPSLNPPRKLSSSPPAPKRHRLSSSSSSSNERLPLVAPPTTATWPSPFLLPSSFPWPSALDINRFQYPFYTPPASLPISSPHPPVSNLFSTLMKGTLSNVTCLLPTFVPLPIPIPIPLCFPVHLPCKKCAVEVADGHCQTDARAPERVRRMSI